MKRLSDYVEAIGDLAYPISLDVGSVQVVDVCHDSRAVGPGSLFFAITGANADGRDYISGAIAAGAIGVVYSGEPIEGLSVPALHVSDAYRALARAAECLHDYPAGDMTIVAVTGTNGKSTTAFLMASILSSAGRRVGVISTLEIRINGESRPTTHTTPMPLQLQQTLAEMKGAGGDTVVLEASSHALDQGRIGTTQADVAIFTNLTQDHLDYHGDMEAYFAAKLRLFTEHLKPDGTAVLNADDPAGRQIAYSLAAANRTYWQVGFAESADFRVEVIEPTLDGTRIELLDRDDERLHLDSRLIGGFNVSNVLGTYAASRALGVAHSTVARAIAAFDGVPGRMQTLPGTNDSIAVIDYAHTDDALAKALETLRGLCVGRLIVVFGCGGDRDRGKRPLMAAHR
jgi:UDP-N-acetylmuramyl-tripeptide synthetase